VSGEFEHFISENPWPSDEPGNRKMLIFLENGSNNFGLNLSKLCTPPELVLFAKYNSNDQVKEDEMGSACRTNGGEEECV
jgi:hypothetical protein